MVDFKNSQIRMVDFKKGTDNERVVVDGSVMEGVMGMG